MKIYHVLLLLCALSFVGCIRDEFTGKEPETHEEVLLQKAKAWYQENMDFVKNNPSTGIDVTHLILNWDHKDFMKNQSGNTIISIPIEGEIRGYKTGALNVLLTKEGASLGVFKLYKESPGSTDMAYYSGTGQLIAKGFYNAEKGTFLPEELGAGISFKGGFTEIEEVVIIVTNPIGGGTIGIGNSGPGTGGIGNGGNPPNNGFPPYGPGRQVGDGDNGNGTYSGNTPCGKTKSTLNRPNVKQGINNVKSQAFSTISNINAGETGFKELKNGTLAPADVNSAHQVVFNNVTDAYGGYHNHTATGTHMFSPPDIVDALFGFAAAQSVQDGAGNAYLGMIAAEWCSTCPNNVQYIHYVIQYTGTGTELGNYVYTPAQMNQFISKYQRKVTELSNTNLNGNAYIKNAAGDLNEKGLEKLFFETLKIIGINGKVNLQRIEPNGAINNVTLNNNGIPVGTPCP